MVIELIKILTQSRLTIPEISGYHNICFLFTSLTVDPERKKCKKNGKNEREKICQKQTKNDCFKPIPC